MIFLGSENIQPVQTFLLVKQEYREALGPTLPGWTDLGTTDLGTTALGPYDIGGIKDGGASDISATFPVGTGVWKYDGTGIHPEGESQRRFTFTLESHLMPMEWEFEFYDENEDGVTPPATSTETFTVTSSGSYLFEAPVGNARQITSVLSFKCPA